MACAVAPHGAGLPGGNHSSPGTGRCKCRSGCCSCSGPACAARRGAHKLSARLPRHRYMHCCTCGHHAACMPLFMFGLILESSYEALPLCRSFSEPCRGKPGHCQSTLSYVLGDHDSSWLQYPWPTVMLRLLCKVQRVNAPCVLAELPAVPHRHLERPHPSAAWTSQWPAPEQDPSFPQNAAEAGDAGPDPRQLAKHDSLATLLHMQASAPLQCP